jgi:predicted nucleotidyltransferase component of viral defense system
VTMDISVHKNILLQILKDIYSAAGIGPILGFKGGTAAYLFYGLGRFSVDLDFDLLDAGKKDLVFEGIEKILKEYGEIKEKYRKLNTIFFMLSYGDRSRNIKVEINLRNFGSQYEIRSYLGISMKVMVQEDMFAHKLVAMTERMGRSNRDIYDIWFSLKNNWPINKGIVEKRTKMPFKNYLKKCISSLEKMSARNILSGMGELLDEKQKVWAKSNLKNDVIFLLKILLDNEG